MLVQRKRNPSRQFDFSRDRENLLQQEGRLIQWCLLAGFVGVLLIEVWLFWQTWGLFF